MVNIISLVILFNEYFKAISLILTPDFIFCGNISNSIFINGILTSIFNKLILSLYLN